MPLSKEVLGTELDGGHSNEYCNLCNAKGEFINKNITFNELLNLGINHIENSDSSKHSNVILS